MGYARFVLPSAPAKVANLATVQPLGPQTVAGLASVAGAHEEISARRASFVASVAVQPIEALHNLCEPQADPNRCHVCGEREAADRLFIAVLTDRPGAHHWLHAACHPEHSRRCAERRAS